MPAKFISDKNLKFLLHEVFDVASLTTHPYYQDHNKETFDMILDTALRMGREILMPPFGEMDKNPPEFVDGRVKVHPSVRTFMKECGEGGWIAANFPAELGGLQLPSMISLACRFIFSAANYSTSVYPALTTGAARLILSFGSDRLKDLYLPRMLAGEWQGTMALTEPQAGSSLADITTVAEPSDNGFYRVRGQKIFISAGDHDGVENVVHLMLAKIKGAPPGVKGISLFVVPKHRLDEDGRLVSNDLNTAGIYHKMGYRGCPITQLSMGENDDCRGYLVGEPHKGLAYMFQMMNEARIGVGMAACAIASAAYYAALDYTGERLQGRKLGSKDPMLPQIPLRKHPDVKRMLLFQKSVVEGSLSLLLQCARYADMVRVSEGEERERWDLLLGLLTPVAKSYPSEMGVLSVSQALQCLGGYGYCDEFPLEQYYRDMRIHPIHEGTTGIQALDLLGRKVRMKEGKALALFVEEVQAAIQRARSWEDLIPCSEELARALEMLKDVTSHLISLSRDRNPEISLADATLYLEFFGLVCVGWQWLIQATAAAGALKAGASESESHFFLGKLHTFRYFFAYELTKIEGLAKSLRTANGLTAQMEPDYFFD